MRKGEGTQEVLSEDQKAGHTLTPCFLCPCSSKGQGLWPVLGPGKGRGHPQPLAGQEQVFLSFPTS